MPDRVVIIGSGPTGLTIAHAAEAVGISREDISIYSHGIPSPLFGAQFLHGEIPGLDLEPFTIEIELSGTMPEYQEKVYSIYRDGPNVPPEVFAQPRIGWDIRSAYNILWGRYRRRVDNVVFTREILDSYYSELVRTNDLPFLFTTMPMRPFCLFPDMHRWEDETVYAAGDSPERSIGIRPPLNTIRYNGLKSPAWYRTANIQGYCTAEWPAHSRAPKPPVAGVVPVIKPLRTNCTCWPGLIPVGRYAEYKKGVLVHDAYDRALKTFSSGVQDVLF